MLLRRILLAMCTVMALGMLSGCSTSDEIDENEGAMTATRAMEDANATTRSEVQTEDITAEEQTTEEAVITTEQSTEAEVQHAQSSTSTENAVSEPTADMYVGTYNDYDNNEPNLKITRNEDGTYKVVIGIFRLTSLEDGVGTLTDNGLEFVATDAAGNPIEGVITLEGNEAVVTFTASTWELIANGTSYRYVRVNDAQMNSK